MMISVGEFNKYFEQYPEVFTKIQQIYETKQESINLRINELQKNKSDFNYQSKKIFMAQKYQDRQEVLSKSINKHATHSYSREEIITERLCQNMINQFPLVNLKQIKRTISREQLRSDSNLSKSFEKSHQLLQNSVTSLRKIEQLKPLAKSMSKLSKSMIAKTNNLYKSYEISQFKVQYYNQSQMYYDYINQHKLDDLRREENQTRLKDIKEAKEQQIIEDKKFRLKPYWQYHREKLLLNDILGEGHNKQMSKIAKVNKL
eukprot:403342891